MESSLMVHKKPEVKIPKLGGPVKGSKSGQPIMVLFDLIGRRWSMGVLWNLSDQDCTFRELQARCQSVSPTVLNTRLKELRIVGLVTQSCDGYTLTEQGRVLFNHLEPLGDWAEGWTKTL
jgi:DNA-binding HxlR family transcriptional regulator